MAWHGSKWIRKERREGIYKRDGYQCVYCEADVSNVKPSHRHLDHLRPRSKGGSNANSNLVTTCHACNCSRQDKAWWHFAAMYGGAKERVQRQRRRVVVKHA